MRNKQRYLCKGCGLNFTNTPARGKPLALKAAAVLLYVSGLSMNRTAQLLGVSTPTIQAWLEQFAAAYAQKPEPEGRAVVIELDEMGPYLKKSPSHSGRRAVRPALYTRPRDPGRQARYCASRLGAFRLTAAKLARRQESGSHRLRGSERSRAHSTNHTVDKRSRLPELISCPPSRRAWGRAANQRNSRAHVGADPGGLRYSWASPPVPGSVDLQASRNA